MGLKTIKPIRYLFINIFQFIVCHPYPCIYYTLQVLGSPILGPASLSELLHSFQLGIENNRDSGKLVLPQIESRLLSVPSMPVTTLSGQSQGSYPFLSHPSKATMPFLFQYTLYTQTIYLENEAISI